LEKWWRKGINAERVTREEMLRYELGRLEEQKNLYWKQCARVHWMKQGDRNTKFFHSAASERKRKNRLKGLKKEDGSVVEDEEAMKDVVSNYF
jgi:hypothetical protein